MLIKHDKSMSSRRYRRSSAGDVSVCWRIPCRLEPRL